MNKEELRSPSVERAIERPVFAERPTRILPKYNEADFMTDEQRRLTAVRSELDKFALLPMVNIIVPTQSAEAAPQEEKPMTFFDLFLGFIALSLIKTGEFMESFGEGQRGEV